MENPEKKELTEEEKIKMLENNFEQERQKFSQKLSSLIPLIRDLNTIAEAQVLMLSYRQMLVDELHKYRTVIFKHKSNDRNLKKLKIEYYKRNYDMKLDQKEMTDYINSDMTLRIQKIDIVENHISYLTETISTLDKMGFAIKNKIATEEINFRGNM